MMNRYSISTNNPLDRTERIYFFYWQDMVEYLRNEMEADGKTYRYKVTDWKEMSHRGENKNKATCQLQWIRINDEGMAEMLTCTVRCEDTSIIPTTTHVWGLHNDKVSYEWKRAEW